jgi:hypothetical protein
LKGGTDSSGARVGLGLNAAIELVPDEVFLLDALKEIDLNGVVVMNE